LTRHPAPRFSGRNLRITAWLLAVSVLLPAGLAEASGRQVRYTVEQGDTLGHIAREYGVSVDDLRRWNGLEGDLIRIGQELTIRTSSGTSRTTRTARATTTGRGGGGGTGGGGSSHLFTYVVERGDTVSEIARRHGVSVQDMVRWNRRLDPDRIRIGQELRIYLDDAPGSSASVGMPNRGRLSISQPLGNGPGFWVRSPSRAYGTNETIDVMAQTFARVRQRYPEAPEVVVGDLSYERGGRMRPHASHQSGRDADIAYYTQGRTDRDGFVVATPENLDVRLTWYLVKSFIDSGQVRYIFIDYNLQAELYEYARRRGASAEELDAWFEYPRRGGTRGIIRHARGHDDHFHIRFRCSSADRRCRD
jgi:LysM repeat protein